MRVAEAHRDTILAALSERAGLLLDRANGRLEDAKRANDPRIADAIRLDADYWLGLYKAARAAEQDIKHPPVACSCECNRVPGWCGGCGHAGCGRR